MFWCPQVHTVSPEKWRMLEWPLATGTHVAPSIILPCVSPIWSQCALHCSPTAMGSAITSSLRFPVDFHWFMLLGSVLVPVTGGGTKQPCMFHHQVCWLGIVLGSKLALWVVTWRILQRLALSSWGEVRQLVSGAAKQPCMPASHPLLSCLGLPPSLLPASLGQFSHLCGHTC